MTDNSKLHKPSGAMIETMICMIKEVVKEEVVRMMEYAAERMVASAVQEVTERAWKIMTPSLMRRSFHLLRT